MSFSAACKARTLHRNEIFRSLFCRECRECRKIDAGFRRQRMLFRDLGKEQTFFEQTFFRGRFSRSGMRFSLQNFLSHTL